MSELLLGDCLERLKELPDCSVESLVTDPPAGISFMGKDWDSDKGGRVGWVAWMTDVMRECHRVMKPGAHGLVWAIPRTSHWTATALEDAGFEIRDVVTHLFGQGFPKSLDISKAIDKAAGAEREKGAIKFKGGSQLGVINDDCWKPKDVHESIPATDAAKQWSGWGTALKPASEHWILVRKPVSEKNVAANVLKWGTGGINVDGCRIEGIKPVMERTATKVAATSMTGQSTGARSTGEMTTEGRFPANLVLSHSPHCTDAQCDIECAILALDTQSGTLKSGARSEGVRKSVGYHGGQGDGGPAIKANSGGASRFFYCAKISPSERNAGLEGEVKKVRRSDARPNSPDMTGKFPDHDGRERVGNHHPTVKPQKLMRYFCRLITPPSGTVLDPFMGSGSTGMAAKSEGFTFIGIERDSEYFKIAEARIASPPRD